MFGNMMFELFFLLLDREQIVIQKHQEDVSEIVAFHFLTPSFFVEMVAKKPPLDDDPTGASECFIRAILGHKK